MLHIEEGKIDELYKALKKANVRMNLEGKKLVLG